MYTKHTKAALLTTGGLLLATVALWQSGNPTQEQEPHANTAPSSKSATDVDSYVTTDVDIDVGNTTTSTSIPTRFTSQMAVNTPAQEEPDNRTTSSPRKLDMVFIPIYTEGTVLSAMQALEAASSTFSFSGSQFPGLGFFVEAIGGQEARAGRHWILYVNDTPATRGVSNTLVTPDDSLVWRYEESLYR